MRRAPFIGRRVELRWLRSRVEAAFAGYPHLVLIEGEPGIGKTRLVLELLDEARAQGATVVRGRCYEHLSLAYLPFRESLFDTLSSSSGANPARETDQAVLDLVRLSAHPDEVAASETDDAQRSRQLLTLTRLVIEMAHAAPTIVFVDDLDWADDATIDLLRHLLFRFDDEDAPLLLIATTRADPHARAGEGVMRLAAESRSATLSLHALSEMEAAELARERGPGIGTDEARRLARAGAGNPLLIDALTRSSGRAGRSSAPTASAMMSAIKARLDELPTEARHLVHVASLLVPDCTASLLGDVTGLAPRALRVALSDAVEHGVLIPDGGEAFAFSHPLYARLANDEVAPLGRESIHAHAATALLARRERGEAVSTRSIAHHLTRAADQADPALLMEFARAAGDEALAIGAWAEAVGHYEAALEAASRDGPPDVLATLHRLAGLSYRGNLELARAVAQFDSAIRCLGPDAGDESLTSFHTWRLRCAIGSRELLDVARDRGPLESLVTRIEQSNPGLAAEAMVELSQSYWIDRQIEESERAGRRALVLGSSSGNHEACARAATSLALSQWSRYDLTASLASLEDGAAVGARSADDDSIAGGPAFRVPLVLAWLGRLDDAERQALECCALAEQVNYPLEEGLPLSALALVAVLRGEFDSAEQYARALVVQHLSGYHWAAGLFLPALFSAHLARGRFDAARDALDTWAETADQIDQLAIGLLRRYASALEGGTSGEGDQLPRLPRTPTLGVDGWAVAEIEIARREGAEVNLRRASDLLQEMERRGGLVAGGLGVLLPRARGVAADLLGDDDAALAALGEAVDLARALRAGPEHARALVDLATIHLRHGRRLEAGALLEDAIERFDRLGMLPDAVRARQLAGRRRAAQASRPQQRARAPDVKTTTAVILFTDVVDSTRLTEELGASRYRALARQVEETVTISAAAHGGSLVAGINLGDGFIALFPTVQGAIAAARQCVREGGPTGLRLHLALHTGEIIIDGSRIYGHPVNYAARLCGLTGPDEILVSNLIRERAEGVPGLAFVDRGQHSLKGIAGRQQLYALVDAPE